MRKMEYTARQIGTTVANWRM